MAGAGRDAVQHRWMRCDRGRQPMLQHWPARPPTHCRSAGQHQHSSAHPAPGECCRRQLYTWLPIPSTPLALTESPFASPTTTTLPKYKAAPTLPDAASPEAWSRRQLFTGQPVPSPPLAPPLKSVCPMPPLPQHEGVPTPLGAHRTWGVVQAAALYLAMLPFPPRLSLNPLSPPTHPCRSTRRRRRSPVPPAPGAWCRRQHCTWQPVRRVWGWSSPRWQRQWQPTYGSWEPPTGVCHRHFHRFNSCCTLGKLS